MNRPRGRPGRGQGVTRDGILDAALALLDEGGGQALSMRTLAARLDVTAMSLYHHVGDRAGLLHALSDRVYQAVLAGSGGESDPCAAIRLLMCRYHAAVGAHPQLTLAIFAEPSAFAGVTREITERLDALLAALTPAHLLWRDILVDHAHGSGLALTAAHGDADRGMAMREQYRLALDALLARLAGPDAVLPSDRDGTLGDRPR